MIRANKEIDVTQPDRILPLFYRQPQALHSHVHGDLRLTAGDYGFAQDTNAVPVAVMEFAATMRHYPIVFAEADSSPLAVLGLERRNRFVADGAWADAYIPAYARRYPFVFASMSEDSFALAVDMDSPRIVRGGTEGEALFAEGKPTPLTEGAMAFCREFHGAHLQTAAFVKALHDNDMFASRHADAKLGSGRPMKLSGFKVVDREKFEALPDDVILEWHRKGWLALIHFHFVSLDRFGDLVERETAADATPVPIPEGARS